MLRSSDPAGANDLFGAKWIVGFPDNPRLGLPAYSALVLLNDALTGVPIGVLDGGPITAARTAAVSGVAIRLFGPPGGQPVRVAVLGAGVQAASHLAMLGHVLPAATVRLVDREPDRAEALARSAQGTSGLASVEAAGSVREAVDAAAIIVSAVSFGPRRQLLDPDWLAPDALFVAVDYDMQAPAALARSARFFVDEREQFLATRSETVFAGYPDPEAMLGDELRAASDGRSTRAPGRILVSHLGVGLADVAFAGAILERAERLGLGLILPR